MKTKQDFKIWDADKAVLDGKYITVNAYFEV